MRPELYFCHRMDEIVNQIEEYKKEIASFAETDAKAVEAFRVKWLGSKGIVIPIVRRLQMRNATGHALTRHFGETAAGDAYIISVGVGRIPLGRTTHAPSLV